MIEKCAPMNVCYDFHVSVACFIYVFVFARLMSNTITISDNVLTISRQCLPIVEQDLIALPEQPSLTPFSWSSCCTIFCFLCALYIIVFFPFCSIVFWPLYCLSFFAFQLLITLRYLQNVLIVINLHRADNFNIAKHMLSWNI